VLVSKGQIALRLALVCLLLAAGAEGVGAQTVNVWLTTPNQSKLL